MFSYCFQRTQTFNCIKVYMQYKTFYTVLLLLPGIHQQAGLNTCTGYFFVKAVGVRTMRKSDPQCIHNSTILYILKYYIIILRKTDPPMPAY